MTTPAPVSRSRLPLLALAAAAALAATPAHADEAALNARIEKLRAQLDAMQAELRALKSTAAPAAAASPIPAGTPAAAPVAATAPAVAAASPSPAAANDSGAATPLPDAMAPGSPFATRAEGPATTFFGYGEINYQNYPKDRSQTQADLARAVIGIGHRFDDNTRFVSEFEWEHAVSSADDAGEVEVEQFYVERSFNPQLAGRAGLFLIPSGLLNTNHEPTQYFGVTRNAVETAIIPTTWREGGLAVTGVTAFDLSWDVGLTTGFNLANWDPNSNEGKESPLGSIHQELSQAKAANLSLYGALNWRGYPGLLLGGSVFGGKAAQDQPNFPSSDAVVTLVEAHARWTPGPFDFSALYARGHISDTAPYNATIVGSPTLVPEAFFGWYVQGGWYAWRSGDYQLAPFVRYEQVNTGSQYATLSAGLTPTALPTETITTVGASFFVTPNIVFKADYQWFRQLSNGDRLQLGLGLNY